MSTWDHCRRAFAWVDHLAPAVVVNIATVGPVGYWGRAPGTNGTVVGLLYVAAVYPTLSPPGALLVLLLSLYLAVAFCDAAEQRLGRRDPGCVILDEVVAMPLCFPGVLGLAYARGWPPWTMALAAFALFRFFDILKPLGINNLQRLPGGLGVVADDVAAALATCLVLNAIVRIG
ncbi:MAG: phosphatidylglycerophosphatase A [Opitutales bacterium]|jgi:phosphatidylglycerophosphatase A